MFKKTRLNKKGFTLVELLAVIVVLAVIMVIAIPSVMDTMTKARSKSFLLFGQKVLNAAQERYQTDILTGTEKDGTKCYTLANVGLDSSKTSYHAIVKVVTVMSPYSVVYTISIADKSFETTNKSYSELNDKLTLGASTASVDAAGVLTSTAVTGSCTAS